MVHPECNNTKHYACARDRFATMIHQDKILNLVASLTTLAWPFMSTCLLWWSSASRIQAILAIFISAFIHEGSQMFSVGQPKSMQHVVCALGAKLLITGIHPIIFRLGPFSCAVVWFFRIFTLLAAGCFLLGIRQGALLYKKQWPDCTHTKCTQSSERKANARKKAVAKPEKETINVIPFESVCDLTDAIGRVFRRGQAGVIITDVSTERSITIEFYWDRCRHANGVNIEFAASATVEAAMDFTIADSSKYEHILLERTMFRNFLVFLHQHANETNEVSSGRRVYRGILP